MKFKKVNTWMGWLVFFNALLTYLLTVERKFSFWDVGEYIISSAKLGITHAPGAATFQLVGAVFSSLAMGNKEYYSLIINSTSALFSAFTILLLYYTITHLAKKVIIGKEGSYSVLTGAQKIIILASGLVGALAFTYTDTFWFSAVEGEVYAMSSLFTALILWLICKWEDQADDLRSNRWLILISLVVGLSVGVHLMSILAVPAVVIIYFVRKYSLSWKNFLIANVVALAVLVVVFKIIFPLTMTYFEKMEIFMVNGLRMPFHSGTIFAFISLVGLSYFSLTYFRKKHMPELYTVSLSIIYMLVGLTTWLVIPIRANANPPVNLNNPDTAIGVLDYYNRVQYGEWPVLYGEMYTAYLEEGAIEIENGEDIYEKDDKQRKYVKVGNRTKYKAIPSQSGFFPKLYNPDPNVMENYARMVGYPKFEINPNYPQSEEERQLVMQLYQEMQDKYNKGEISIQDYQRAKNYSRQGEPIFFIKKPTFFQNLNYFINFQMGYMYFRYLMWNFTGRQNDWEGNKEVTRGNWLSGIPVIDNARLGDQQLLPEEYKNNKARNKYFLLPFLLGLLGLVYQSSRDPGRAYALLVLFALTSFGIIMYTSVKPFEPRERDYAVVSSFYVFAIWIGMGVLALFQLLKQKDNKSLAYLIGGLLLAIPIWMGFQNWDDHDRSERKTAYDLAKNYLQGLDKNALLFVYGDNDTYPLWGLQETEQYRDDVKIINFTLLSSSWNINQVKRTTYNAPPIPGKMTYDDYKLGVNDQVLVLSKENMIQKINDAAAMYESGMLSQVDLNNIMKMQLYLQKDEMSVQEALSFLKQKTPEKTSFLKMFTDNPDAGDLNFIPVNKFYFPVDKNAVIKNKIVEKQDIDKIVDTIKFEVTTSALYKAEMIMMDILGDYKWDRPIYFSAGGLYDNRNQLYLNNYMQYEGFVYKLVPIYTKEDPYNFAGYVNVDLLKNRIENYRWGNLNNSKTYFDETCKRNIISYSSAVGRCVDGLIEKGRYKEAREMIGLLQSEIPLSMYPNLLSWNTVASQLNQLGDVNNSQKIIDIKIKEFQDKYRYYESLNYDRQNSVFSEIVTNRQTYVSLVNSMIAPFVDKNNAKAKSIFMELYKPVLKNTQAYIKWLDSKTDEELADQRIIIKERFSLLSELESVLSQVTGEDEINIDQGLKEQLDKKYRVIYSTTGR